MSDGSGSVLALAELSSTEPKNVKSNATGFTTWACNFNYTAQFDLESPVYSFKASMGDLRTDARTLRREEIEGGDAPFLFLSYAPGVG